MSHAAPLFQPFSFKGLHLANRIVMAPMTRSFSPSGVPTEKVSEYYRKRAASAVGLIAPRQVMTPMCRTFGVMRRWALGST
jgi:2,4-dienoyl-CoA reductase-like NADH-dependent reductase (Old Yellow Enzyme family)